MVIPSRQLPKSNLSLSVLGLGTAPFGGEGWGGQDDSASMEAMEEGLKHGISHIDTAAHYGNGRSEQVVGSFIQRHREQIVLASKAFPMEVTADYMQRQVDDSRQRLGVDVIDLFYIHWPRAGQDLRPIMEGLEAARQSRKIRFIGVSNFSVDQMEQVSEVGQIDVHQLCYNMLWRFPEREVIPYCIAHNIGVISYATLAFGILTGKYVSMPTFSEGDFRPNTVFFDPALWGTLSAAVERLRDVWAPSKRPLSHLATLWTITQPGVVCALAGVRNAHQVTELAGGANGELPDEVIRVADEVGDDMLHSLPDTGNVFRFYP